MRDFRGKWRLRAAAVVLRRWLFACSACCTVLLLGLGGARAQQITLRQYLQNDGLANLDVSCLLQDHAGFLWVCTGNGLFRYDGADFERFAEGEGLADVAVHDALEDGSGRIWVATPHGLFAGDGDRFIEVRPDGHALAIDRGRRMAALPGGRMLVIAADGVIELGRTPSGDWHARPFLDAAQLDATPALSHPDSVFVDRHGRAWFGCGGHICRVAAGRVETFDAGHGVPQDTWLGWLLDADDRLWVRGLGHLAVRAPGADRFTLRDPPHSRLTADILSVPLILDSAGRVLTRTDTGLARWEQDHWRTYDASNGIVSSNVRALVMGRDGTLWLGQSGHGVARWLGYENLESWTAAQGLGGDAVWSIARSPAWGIVVATRGGCALVDAPSGRASPCRVDGLPKGEIQLAASDRDGRLWLALTTGELYRVDVGRHRATLQANVPLMRKLYVDSAGRIWIASDNGVFVVARGGTSVERVPLPHTLGETTDIVEDETGALWFASQRGLLRWLDGRWTDLRIDDEHARFGFQTVASEGGGWLWAGSTTHGLLHLHVDGDHADRYDWVKDESLARATIYFSQRDARGWIWAGTDAGIAIFDGSTWRRFSQQDGLIWNDLDQNSVLLDGDGSAWIGTSAGLTHIRQPERLMQSQSAALDLRLTHAAFGARPLDAGASSRIAWDRSASLKLHLAALNLVEPRQTFFRVRLRGLADAWLETREREFDYPGLKPGAYEFEAVAIDRERERESAPLRLSFEILPPWWETTWFRILAVAAIAGALIQAWRWRMHHLDARRKELERQVREREVLIERATRDSLTGLWNRVAMLERLAHEMNVARTYAKPLVIAIIDIDHFKRINDTRGHLVGDAVLRALGTHLRDSVRASDAVGRYGGEEFLVVAAGMPRQSPLLPFERMRRTIPEIRFAVDGGGELSVSASFGVAWFEPDTDTVESLLKRADEALYAAKNGGRNRVEYAAARASLAA